MVEIRQPGYNLAMNDQMSPMILALAADLFFTSRIQSTADGLGLRVAWVEDAGQVGEEPAEFVRLLKEHRPALVLVDLSLEAVPWAEWVRAAKADSETEDVPFLAFGSHKGKEKLKLAADVGVDQVVAKSKFSGEMPALFKKHARES